MSELKVKGVDDVYIEYFNTGNHDLAKVYLKTEVDHYIEELEEKHKKEVEQWLILNREQANATNRLRDSMEQSLRHHKYKRSLDKAKSCESEEKRLEAIAPIFDTDKECWEYNSDYWYKWRERWLKIANQFKETK